MDAVAFCHELWKMWTGAAVSQDGKRLHVVGGRDSNYKGLASAECLAIEENKWSSIPPMSTCRHALGLAMSPDGKRLYAAGGFVGSGHYLNTVEHYDFDSKKWGKFPIYANKKCKFWLSLRKTAIVCYWWDK